MLDGIRYAVIWLPLLAACAVGDVSYPANDSSGSHDRSISSAEFSGWPDSALDRPPGSRDWGAEMGAGKDSLAAADGARDGQSDGATVARDLKAEPFPDRGAADQGLADLNTPDLAPYTGPNIGALCTSSAECTKGAACLLSVRGQAMCTMTCTPDNAATAANEDSCVDRGRHICGTVSLVSGGDANYCLRRCQPRSDGNDCDPPFACEVSSGTIAGRLGSGVCMTLACKGPADCPVFTAKSCVASSGLGCEVSQGERCLAESTGARCVVGGVCNASSGLCEGHEKGLSGAKIGDPCDADVECGNHMYCLRERGTGSAIRWRNGYCAIFGCEFGASVAAFACPAGSSCNRAFVGPNGVCQRSCTLGDAGSCRGYGHDQLGDYECYAWNRLMSGGQAIAQTPVCDTPLGCDVLQDNCNALGDGTNSSAMGCRDHQNLTLSDPRDPAGLCLDNSAAGPIP